MKKYKFQLVLITIFILLCVWCFFAIKKTGDKNPLSPNYIANGWEGMDEREISIRRKLILVGRFLQTNNGSFYYRESEGIYVEGYFEEGNIYLSDKNTFISLSELSNIKNSHFDTNKEWGTTWLAGIILKNIKED